MSKNYWLIVLFVATMVCNGLCRPREVDSTKMYPVYRSVKQLELDTAQNRYEKPFRVKRDDDDDDDDKDSVTYMRIDIPYKNLTQSRGPGVWLSNNSASNNTKSVIDYVPVALTVKKTNIKKWPSDQNGIESADDLALYNIYTSNVNPLNSDHQTTQGNDHVFTYPPHSKPSILILEELTTRKPFQDYPDSVYTRPIQVINRPFEPPQSLYPGYPVQTPHRPTEPQPPVYVEHNFTYEINRPIGTTSFPTIPDNPTHPGYDYPPIHYPDYNPDPGPTLPPYPPSPPFEETTNHHFGYMPSTPEPEVTTKKVKNTKCPSVSIIATNSIHNINNEIKEGCQDINIHINTNLNNSNAITAKPPSTTVQNGPTIPQFGLFSIFGVFWSIISRFFNFSFSNPFLSTVLAPFLVFALPWVLPHLISGRKRQGKRLIVVGNQETQSTKYLYRSIGEDMHYLKRTARDLRHPLYPMYRGWSERKKIPRSEVSATQDSSVKTENESSIISNSPKEAKIGIESIATVARASSDGPSLSSSATIGQLMDTVGQMVDSDIRTPPKLKEIIKEKFNDNRREALGEEEYPVTFIYDEHVTREDDMSHFEFTEKSLLSDSSEGKAAVNNVKVVMDEGVKGIAIPVVMDEDLEPTAPPKKLQKIPEVPKPVKDEKKKNGITKSSHSTTTPSSGLSTWILLSDNREVTTISPKKNGNNNNNKKEGNDDKKKTTGTATTTKKPGKVQATTQKTSSTQAIKKTTSKPGSKTPEEDTSAMSALEAMVKNQKKSLTTTAKPKTNDETKSGSSKRPGTDSKKKVAERIDVAETKDKFEIELPDSKVTYTLPPRLPIATDDKAVTTSSSQTNPQSTTENSVEGTTKKKKVTTKKKKKNKNRRRKPSNDTGVEAKIPKQPVSSQIYSFLSREIVPTVGLGLIGVALTAGLASFLGYNPFQSSTVPLRRTYVTNHGYSPNSYYNYNTDYGDGGQSEEVLFREVLSGMPEESRYGLTHTDTSYPEAYNRQDQVYDNMKTPVYGTGSGSVYGSDKDMGSYDANYPQDYSTGYGASYDTQDKKYSTEVKDKYPVYNRDGSTSFVYPDTNGVTPADKASRLNDEYSTQSSAGEKFTKPDTIERQPEALYRVASESDLQYRNGESTIQGISSQSSWHRIGSPMEAKKHYPHLEPGPRSLDLNKESKDAKVHKRTKRGAESVIQRISRKRTKKENDVENEIDFDESKFTDQNPFEDMSSIKAAYTEPTTTESTTTTTTAPTTTTTSTTTTTTTEASTTEDAKEINSPEPTETYETDTDPTGPGSAGVSVLDILKRLAQFKLRLGLNFLRSTTDMFSRYLDDIQRRVEETFINTTSVQYNRRNPWSRIFFSRLNDDGGDYYRRKRSVLNENQFSDEKMFKMEQNGEEDKTIESLSKSTKKDLKPSDKVFHQKKNAPKKYQSRDTFKKVSGRSNKTFWSLSLDMNRTIL